MAFIQPDTRIWLCNNVPLNASYDDTILFKTKQEQQSYFMSKAVFTPTQFSVLKERDGVLRMSGSVGNYYNINYMIFTNSNFSDKYFYAFVTSIEYINPNLTYVYFTLDKIQTWLFDFQIEESLVEREHVEDDSLFKNLENEGIDVQERLAYNTETFDQYIGSKIIVLGATENIINFKPGEVWQIQFDRSKIDGNLLDIVVIPQTIEILAPRDINENLDIGEKIKVTYNVDLDVFYVPNEVTSFKFECQDLLHSLTIKATQDFNSYDFNFTLLKESDKNE